MKLSTLLESPNDKIFEWLHDKENVRLETVTKELDNAQFLTKETVKINGNQVEIDLSKGTGGEGFNNQQINFILRKDAPFQFMKLKCERLHVKSGIKCPETMDGLLDLKGEGSEDSFAGCSKHITGTLRCEDIESLKDIHKHVKTIGEDLLIGWARRNILGAILIDVKDIRCMSGRSYKARDAANIIKKYIGQGMKGVTKAQRELIAADLDNYADL